MNRCDAQEQYVNLIECARWKNPQFRRGQKHPGYEIHHIIRNRAAEKNTITLSH